MSEPFDPSDAEQRFREALARGAASEILHLADELQRAGDFARSREWLEEAWAALPSEPRIAARLLEIHHRYRNWSAFDALAAEALAAHGNCGELYFTVGCGEEARGAWERAWEAFGRASQIAPDELEPVLRMARAYRLARRVDDAIRVLEEAQAHHPKAAPLHAALGYAHIQAERADKAVPCFERAIELQPDWHPYLDDLGGALMLCEQWREAARVASWSLKLRKKNERAWTVYAIAHNRMGDLERAEQGYRNALRAARDPSRAKGNYGLFLAKHPERILEAVRLLKAARKAHPDWVEVRSKLAGLLDQRP